MGTGGAPEGVLTAAAMRCLNGEIQGRLVLTRPVGRGAPAEDGHHGPRAGLPAPRTWPRAGTSSSPRPASPTATLLKGVRFFGDGIRTHCLVMTTEPHQVRFIDTIHVEDGPDVVIRF